MPRVNFRVDPTLAFCYYAGHGWGARHPHGGTAGHGPRPGRGRGGARRAVRAYGKVTPRFWTGPTGRRIRAAGPEAQVVALYLLTGPHANMLGLYYLPLPYVGHETGLGPDAVARALAALVAGGFCRYDPETEFVWVMEMARYQVGDALSPRDKRVAGVARALARLPQNPFKAAFLEQYGAAFHLGPANPGAP